MADALIHGRRRDHRTWYCPNGHPRHYPGESDIEKAQRLQREAERVAEAHRMMRESEARRRASAEHRLRAQKGVTTKLRKRIAAGACPCCKRSFQNLARHMQTKHPEYPGSEGGDA